MKQTLEQATMELICDNSRLLKVYITSVNNSWNNQVKKVLGELKSLTEKVGFAIIDSDQYALKTSNDEAEVMFSKDGGISYIKFGEDKWTYNTLSPDGKRIWIYETEQALKGFRETADIKEYISMIPNCVGRIS